MRPTRLLAALLLAGCTGHRAAESSAAAEAPLDTAVVVPAGGTIAVRGTDLALTFERVVEDSRCPLGVMCIQAGTARVALRAREGGRDVPFTMTLGPTGADTTVGAWRIALQSLDPVRRQHDSIAPADYRLQLSVTRDSTGVR